MILFKEHKDDTEIKSQIKQFCKVINKQKKLLRPYIKLDCKHFQALVMY